MRQSITITTIKKISGLFILLTVFTFTTIHAAGDVTEFNVDGLKVILKNSPKEVISISLFVEGGVTNYPKSQEGIESMALEFAMTGGTTSQDKITFNAAAEKMGTQYTSTTNFDYGTLDMTCVKMFWDESWKLFADAVMHPAFDADEFDLLSELMISKAETAASDPDTHLRSIAMNTAYAGSAYANVPAGTAGSLRSLDLEAVTNYYKEVIGKERIFLVVVGNVSENDIRAKVVASLAKLPAGSPAIYEERALIEEGGSYVEDRDIATNYIRGLMSAPTADTKEGMAMQMGMSILYDHFFLEIRTKRGLSYAPAAFYATGILKNPYSAFYVSTVDPAQSMQVMIDEVNKIKKVGFSEKELRNKKQSFLTRNLLGKETTSAQANTLGQFELLGGWELAENFTDRSNALTLEEINHVFDKYTSSIQWTYLGKSDMVKAENFLQPEGTLEIILPQD